MPTDESIEGIQQGRQENWYFEKITEARQKMKLAIELIIALVLFVFLAPYAAEAAEVTLEWDAVTTNDDGTPITDLYGYNLYQREGANPYDYNNPALSTTATTATLSGLGTGDYYWVVRAVNTGGFESADSNEVNQSILIRPGAPLNLRVVSQ